MKVLSTVPANRLDRCRRVRQYTQIRWKRWSQEYLNQLQEKKMVSGEGPHLGYRGNRLDTGGEP